MSYQIIYITITDEDPLSQMNKGIKAKIKHENIIYQCFSNFLNNLLSEISEIIFKKKE